LGFGGWRLNSRIIYKKEIKEGKAKIILETEAFGLLKGNGLWMETF
jgi:hypothetical protein